MSDYVNLFDEAAQETEPPKSSSGYADFFGHALDIITNPVGQGAAYSLGQIKQAFTPDTRTEGVQAGESERSPNYPTQAMTDVGPSDLYNVSIAAGMGKMALGAVPKIDITPPEAPPAPLELPRPFDLETTAEAVPEPSVSPKTGYMDLFNEAGRDPSKMVAPAMEETGFTGFKGEIPETKPFQEPGAIKADLATKESDVLRPDNIIERSKDLVGNEAGQITLGKPAEPYTKGQEVDITSDKEGRPEQTVKYDGPMMKPPSEAFMKAQGYSEAKIQKMLEDSAQPMFRLSKPILDDAGQPVHGVDSTVSLDTLQKHGYDIKPSSSESGQVSLPTKESLEAYSNKFDISGQYDPVQAAKAEHFGTIAAKSFQDSIDIKNIDSKLTNPESEAMHYVAENSPISSKTTPDVAALVMKPSPAMLEALAKYKPWAQEKANELKAVPGFSEREQYAPHILNQPSQALATSQGRVTGSTPFTKQRVLENLAEAENQGYSRKFDRFGDTLTAYSNSVNKAVAEQRFANGLKDMKDSTGNPIAYPKDSRDKPLQFKDGASLSPLLKDYVFSPEAYEQMRFMKGLETPNNVMRALEKTNAVMKKSELALGLFHYMTLTEGGLSLGVNPLKLYNTLQEASKVGGAAFVRPELTKDFLQHNGVISAPTEIKEGLIKDVADQLDKGITYAAGKLGASQTESTIANNLAKPAIALENMLDKSLWHMYQPALKLLAYEHNVAVALSKPENAKLPIDEVKRQVADTVNNFLGGQPWELLMNNPNYVKALKQGFLSADWTTSNIRVPLGLADANVKGQTTRRAYWKLGLMFLGMTELGTMLNKKIQGEKDWQLGSAGNDVNHKFDMFMYRDKAGMSHYAAVNKAFTEPYKYFTDPIKAIMHKLAPGIQTTIEQGTGHTSTGYDLKFQKPGNRAKTIASKFVPFIASGSSFAGTWPMSQGISITGLKEGLTTAVYKDDQKAIDQLRQTAIKNGLGGKFNKILANVKYEVKGTEKYELKKKNTPGALSQYTKAMMGFNLGDTMSQAFADIKAKMAPNTPTQTKEPSSNEPF